MEAPQVKVDAKGIMILATLGIVAFGVWYLYELIQGFKKDMNKYQAFANNHPNLAALLVSAGVTGPGGQYPDTTGAQGQAAEQAAFSAVVNNQSQGFYNAALQQYSYDQGMAGTFDAQGTEGWPWTSYDFWKSKNYPPLPTASSVTVDQNGVYGNDYTP